MRLVAAMSSRRFAVFSSLLALLLLAVIAARGVQAKDKTLGEEAEEPVFNSKPVAQEPLESVPQPNDVRLEDYESDDERPPLEPSFVGAVVFDEPVPGSPAWLSKLFCPLPARPEMLASDTPDAAEAEKLRTLRDSYEEILKEKASLLNAEALSAEIELQRRQVTELKALKELQKLQQSLQELSDKFPDSDAGRRARDVLQLLKQRGANSPLNLTPTPDDGFRHPNSAPRYWQEKSVEEEPIPGFQDDRIRPRAKPQDQPIRSKIVPVPIDENQ